MPIINRNKDALYGSLLFFSIFPLLPYGIISVGTGMLFLAMLLFSNFKGYRAQDRYHSLQVGLMFLVLTVISVFLSEDIGEAFKLLIRFLPLLLVILLTPFVKRDALNEKRTTIVLHLFVLSTYILLLLLYFKSILLGIKMGLPFYDLVKEVSKESSYLDLHPTYISMYVLMSMAILIDRLKKKEKIKEKILVVFLIALGVSSLLLLASRIAIIVMFIYLLIILPGRGWKFSVALVLVILSFAALYYITPLRLQINDVLTSNLGLPKSKFPTTVETRIGIYYCSWEVISGHWFIGSGLGDFQGLLSKCYETLETDSLFRHNYNSHNYYLFLWGTMGIIAVLLFIAALCINFVKAIRSHHFVEVCFWLILIFFCLTESVLVRSYGISFFVYFYAIFRLIKGYKWYL